MSAAACWSQAQAEQPRQKPRTESGGMRWHGGALCGARCGRRRAASSDALWQPAYIDLVAQRQYAVERRRRPPPPAPRRRRRRSSSRTQGPCEASGSGGSLLTSARTESQNCVGAWRCGTWPWHQSGTRGTTVAQRWPPRGRRVGNSLCRQDRFCRSCVLSFVACSAPGGAPSPALLLLPGALGPCLHRPPPPSQDCVRPPSLALLPTHRRPARLHPRPY